MDIAASGTKCEGRVSAGGSEFGLSTSEIAAMVDATVESTRTTRRRIDRALMNGEWPVVPKGMGNGAANGVRRLLVDEMHSLFQRCRLPKLFQLKPGERQPLDQEVPLS